MSWRKLLWHIVRLKRFPYSFSGTRPSVFDIVTLKLNWICLNVKRASRGFDCRLRKQLSIEQLDILIAYIRPGMASNVACLGHARSCLMVQLDFPTCNFPLVLNGNICLNSTPVWDITVCNEWPWFTGLDCKWPKTLCPALSLRHDHILTLLRYKYYMCWKLFAPCKKRTDFADVAVGSFSSTLQVSGSLITMSILLIFWQWKVKTFLDNYTPNENKHVSYVKASVNDILKKKKKKKNVS